MSEPTTATAFDTIGGAEAVAAIVDRFYDLMDQDPRFPELRALHGADLGPMRASLTGFLIAWLGGPRDWFTKRPGTCIMSLHAQIRIAPHTAGQWTDAMSQALSDCGVDPALRSRMGEALSRVAQGMV